MKKSQTAAGSEKGLSLVEVLVTLALTGFMLGAIVGLQALVRRHHALSRHQEVALFLARARLDELRLRLASGAVPRSGGDRIGARADIPLEGAELRYQRLWSVSPPTPPHRAWRLRVEVTWEEADHTPVTVVLHGQASMRDRFDRAILTRLGRTTPRLPPPPRAAGSQPAGMP